MPQTEEKALEIIETIATEMKIPQKVEGLRYRADYQDYQILLDETFHCEFREKLIDLLAENIKDKEARKEVEFRLKHPVEFEDWE